MNNAIKSDDKEAINKLNEKLVKLIKYQDEMKEANAHYREFGTMKGYSDWSDEKAAKTNANIKKYHSSNQQPFPQYALTNNSSEIRRIKKRFEQLSKVQNNESCEYKTEGLGFRVEENKEIMRIQIFFDGKPAANIRMYLNEHGFKCAPSQNYAWQRLLNENGRWAVKRFIEKQKEAK